MKVKKEMIVGTLFILSITRPYIEVLYYPYVAFRAIALGLIIVMLNKSIHFLHRDVSLVVLLLSAGMMASTIINKMELNSIIQCFFFILTVYCGFIVVTHYQRRKKLIDFIKLTYRILLFYILISDIFTLFNPKGIDEYYIAGSKFMVVYVHCFVMALFAYAYRGKYNKLSLFKRSLLFLYVIESLLIAHIVNCDSGILIIFAFFLALLLPQKIKRFFSSGKMYIIVFYVANAVFFGTNILVSNTFINNFIVNILGKSDSFYGRLIIYDKIGSIIQRQPAIGYGYASTVVNDVVTFGNAQNGLLHLLIQFGIVGTIIWTIFIIVSCNISEYDENNWPLWDYIYILFFASLIEIPFNLYFYLAIAIIYGLGVNQHKNIRLGRIRLKRKNSRTQL